MAKKKPEHDMRMLPIDDIQPNLWNPNVEDADTFNQLVENIKEVGFVDPVQVVKTEEGYVIVGGEHRWKAAKLAGLKEIPAVILDWDEDMQKIQTVKLNVLRGKLDPEKFTKLFLELEAKYGREALRKMMGLAGKDAVFRALLREVKKGLPDEVKAEIDRRAEKIRNVEDLAAVVNSLYARFGSTVQYSYMLLTYGGKLHLMVKLSDKAFARVKEIAEQCREKGKDINEEFERWLRK